MNSIKNLLQLKRFVFPVSILAIVMVVFSAALVQDVHNFQVRILGSTNNFHIEVAGSLDSVWDPNTATWFAGGSNVTISPYETFPDIPIGQSVTAKLAVRDTSTTLPAQLKLNLVNPDSVEANSAVPSLFNQLYIKITKNGQTISEGLAPTMVNVSLGQIVAGEIAVFEISLSFPQNLDASYKNLRTGMQLQVEGESR